MEPISLIIFGVILLIVYYFWGRTSGGTQTSGNNQGIYPDLSKLKNNSIFRMYGGGTRENFKLMLLFIFLTYLVRKVFHKSGQISLFFSFGKELLTDITKLPI